MHAIKPPFTALRVLMIFDGLIFTLFEVQYPLQFPHAVGEDGKRKWGTGRSATNRGLVR
jgi:hypothetical protein